jgi:hypothetical protein
MGAHLSVNKKAGVGGVSGGSGGGVGGGIGGPWNLVFFDDFSAGTVAEGSMFGVNGDHAQGLGSYKNWGAQTYLTTYGSQNGTGDYYGINNMSVVSGISGSTGNCMRMRLIHNDGTGKRVGANPYPNLGSYGAGAAASAMLYGRVETRFKADQVALWKTAWLWWPKTWAWTNEMDFPEGNLNSTIGGFVHKPLSPSTNAAFYTTGSATYATWHTSALEWTPTGVKFFLDDMTTPVMSTSVHPAEPMFWMAQTENPLSGSQPSLDANVYMDHCSMWTYTG